MLHTQDRTHARTYAHTHTHTPGARVASHTGSQQQALASEPRFSRARLAAHMSRLTVSQPRRAPSGRLDTVHTHQHMLSSLSTTPPPPPPPATPTAVPVNLCRPSCPIPTARRSFAPGELVRSFSRRPKLAFRRTGPPGAECGSPSCPRRWSRAGTPRSSGPTVPANREVWTRGDRVAPSAWTCGAGPPPGSR